MRFTQGPCFHRRCPRMTAITPCRLTIIPTPDRCWHILPLRHLLRHFVARPYTPNVTIFVQSARDREMTRPVTNVRLIVSGYLVESVGFLDGSPLRLSANTLTTKRKGRCSPNCVQLASICSVVRDMTGWPFSPPPLARFPQDIAADTQSRTC